MPKSDELIVHYRAGPGWMVSLFLIPGIVLGLGAAVFAFFYYTHRCPLGMLSQGILLALSSILCLFIASRAGQKKIIMTKHGLFFPSHFMFSMLFRLERKWSDVGAVALEDVAQEEQSSTADEQLRMVFHFGSGGKASICLAHLSPDGLDAIFKASKRWGSTAVMAPELIELRRKLLSGPASNKSFSLTALFDEELRSHFTATNFVPLAPDTTLQNNRLQVVSQIGAGGFSAVYLVQRSDNRKMILKEMVIPCLSEEKLSNKAKELFDREGQLLIKLNHPQIAKVFDHFVENGRNYLLLEYVPGQSLRQLLAIEGPQSEEKVLSWCHIIAGILDYLHGQNPPLIHRDLTPDNLILSSENQLHLIDFGAAHEFIGTATGTLIGKQSYISPEQFRGKPEPRSDLYSLGSTLFFLLTGCEPEALTVSHPRSVRPFISTQVDEFVAGLTALSAEERPASCREVMQKIAELRSMERSTIIQLRNTK